MSRRVRNWRSNQFSSSHRNRELNFYCFSRTRKKVFLKWRFPTISLQVKVLFYFMCFKNPCEFELNWFKLVWVSIHFIYSLLSSMKINCPVIYFSIRETKKKRFNYVDSIPDMDYWPNSFGHVGWILVKFFFCVFMNQAGVEVTSKKRMRPISSHFDRTSLVITWEREHFCFLRAQPVI